jgi:ribosomal protein S18 acetylase RimI-like enzyme
MQRAAVVRVREAVGETDHGVTHELFLEYAASLGFNLCFQDFESELASLPGAYAPPGGCILLAETGGTVCGCVAMRPFSDSVCEMKRLYVRPGSRGLGTGRALAVTVIAKARERGYVQMRLDTLAAMDEATRLYESLGFREIEAYRQNPVVGARFFELDLRADWPAG